MTTDTDGEQLDKLVAHVLQSKKYRRVSSDLIRNIGARELANRQDINSATKATKSKLHQITGAFLDGHLDFAAMLDDVRRARENADSVRSACGRAMARHASSRERLAGLDAFYQRLFARLPPIHSVLDIACGLNPLAIPWMPLAPHARYEASDVCCDLVSFLQEAMPLLAGSTKATCCDVSEVTSWEPFDLVLLLKVIPTLDQIDPFASARLLDRLQARYIALSFPVWSLSGREKGMRASYEARFRTLAMGRNWNIDQLNETGEVVFLVSSRSRQ